MSRDTHDQPRKLRPQFWNYPAIAVALTFLVVLLLLLLPRPGHVRARDVARRAVCINNLKRIGIALQTYHEEHKTFPPPVINDKHGNLMHSWRAILLPYLEDEYASQLAKQYRFDEPWNGPNNRRLFDEMPEVYRCPNDEDNQSETNYLAVVGPETMWRGAEAMRIRDMSDGISRTIAVVECADSGINWLEPRDVTFADAEAGINKLTGRPGIRSHHAGGAEALFADGSVHFLSNEIKSETLRGLLTPAGGENVDIPE